MYNVKLTQLQEWNELLKEGIITQEEFNKKKAELIGTPLPQSARENLNIKSIEEKTVLQPKLTEKPVIETEVKTDAINYTPSSVLTEDSIEAELPKKRTWLMIAAASLLLIITASVLSYFFYFKQKWIDDKALRYYVSASSVSLRSTKIAGIDNNYVGSVPYGAELITYDYQPDWSEVKYNAQKGYVSSKYILSKQDFLLLNSIFGDNISRDAIESNKCRIALLDYFRRNSLKGVMDTATERIIFGDVNPNRETWQIFTRPKDVKPNTIFYPNKIVNHSSRFTDFAFIIKNITNGKRNTVLYSFSDDETPQFVADEKDPIMGYQTPSSGYLIGVSKLSEAEMQPVLQAEGYCNSYLFKYSDH